MLQNLPRKAIFLLLVILTFGNYHIYSQNENAAPLSIQKRDVKMTRIPLKYFLADFANSNNIPMSFVSDTAFDLISFEIKNADTEEIFDAIVRAKPSYVWEKQNDVVRFFPKNNQSKILENLLDTKIAKFTIEPNSTANDTAAKILDLTEIKDVLSKSNTNYLADQNREGNKALNVISSLKFNDLTLRELLDNVVKTSRAKFWSLEFKHAQNDYRISLTFH